MFAEILLAIKSLGAMADLFKEMISEIKALSLAIEQKGNDDFKKGIVDELEKIKSAKTDTEYRSLVTELTKRLSS